ncbi:MAG: hypothetical protein ACP59X_18285 [Solidesulfovibrio sp. DCME]|uniref:hypothetical protein n=1 Tax=Solidesulfovibrio sp. DCME TaxID=3447380 RepID=UPI003D0E2D72
MPKKFLNIFKPFRAPIGQHIGNVGPSCYERPMAAKSDKNTVYNTDRLKRVAFWYWEYMRRNPLYRRYCAVIERYNDYFKSLGVFDYMECREYLEEMASYTSAHEDCHDLAHNPFRSRLENDFGKEAGMKYWKYGFLSYGFEKHFGRIYKHHSIGIDTDETLKKLLSGEDIVFSVKGSADISALTKLNGSWMIKIDEMTPSNFLYNLEKSNSITIDPKAILNNPTKFGLEVHALNMINKAVESLFGKQHIDEETLQSVYKLSLSGKHINSSDTMRLAMLWLWDKAHEKDGRKPESFDAVYPLLKDKINASGMLDGAWEQIFTRRKRIVGYYGVTDFCIQNHTIKPFSK